MVVFLLAIASSSFASVQSSINSALNYLKITQLDNGRWAGTETTDFYNTFSVMEAFTQLGVNDEASKAGLQWIQNFDSQNSDYLAKRIIVKFTMPA